MTPQFTARKTAVSRGFFPPVPRDTAIQSRKARFQAIMTDEESFTSSSGSLSTSVDSEILDASQDSAGSLILWSRIATVTKTALPTTKFRSRTIASTVHFTMVPN